MLDWIHSHITDRLGQQLIHTSAIFALIRLPQNYDEAAALAAIVAAVIGASCTVYATFFKHNKDSK